MAKKSAKIVAAESPHLMESLLPREGEKRLEDYAIELVGKASALAGQLHPGVQMAVGGLVRSMNCY